MNSWTPERIAKLRRASSFDHAPDCQCAMCDVVAALDEIERLQARVAEAGEERAGRASQIAALMSDCTALRKAVEDWRTRDQRREQLLRDVLDVWRYPDAHNDQSVAKIEARIRDELGDAG